MVTTSQIPEESNEPPEPHPHQALSSEPTAGEKFGHTTGLHNGDPVGSSEVACSPGSPTPPALTYQVAVQQSNGPVVSSDPIAFDYAPSANQPKFSPNGTTVTSEEDPSEKSSSYQGVDAHWFSPVEVARYLGVSLEHGLAPQDAQARMARDGPNKLEGDEGVGVWRVLVRQVSNSLTLVSWKKKISYAHFFFVAFFALLFLRDFRSGATSTPYAVCTLYSDDRKSVTPSQISHRHLVDMIYFIFPISQHSQYTTVSYTSLLGNHWQLHPCWDACTPISIHYIYQFDSRHIQASIRGEGRKQFSWLFVRLGYGQCFAWMYDSGGVPPSVVVHSILTLTSSARNERFQLKPRLPSKYWAHGRLSQLLEERILERKLKRNPSMQCFLHFVPFIICISFP